jgi:RHS repeat-associated protein
VQHVEYVPFGEVFLEERNNTWNTPYLFNAKELDEETGLYYYGARYYDSRVSLWLGVDLLAEEYPGISVYAYCFGNPVKLIDPDGCGPIPRTQKAEYKGRPWYEKAVVFLNNTAASIVNVPVDIINSCIDESVFIYSNGLGEYFKAGSDTYTNMWNATVADLSRPLSEQLQSLGNDFSNPETYEDLAANALLLVVAKKLPTPANGATQAAKTTAAVESTTAAKGGANLAKTPAGRSGNVLNVVTKNTSTTINGTKFTGHALDQMQARGILSPSGVLDVVKNPAKMFPGNTPGTTVFIRDNLKVITNKAGDIITVIPQ